MLAVLWNWLRPRRGGMWDHISPADLRRIPAGLCGCDALSWSSASPRPHAPEVCAKWREVRVLEDQLALPDAVPRKDTER